MTSDEFGDIEQLDENLRKWFKEKWVRFGPDGKIRGACARGSDKEGKPKCLPQSKAHSLGKKGRKYAAAKKRREDPNPERRGKAKNVATKKKSNEEIQVNEKWSQKYKDSINCSNPKGFSQKAHCAGKKKNEDINEGIPFNQCPSCRGPIVHESMMNEKQDACYHKVKSRYKVWPSAYASGALVQCRKKGASNWGTGGKKKNESSIMKGIVDESENVLVLYIDGKPSTKYAKDHEAKSDVERLQAKFPNKKFELKREMREASGTPGGLEMFRTPAMVNATMQQNLYKRELAPIKAAEKKRKEAEYRKNNPSVSVPNIQIGASNYPIPVIQSWIDNKDFNAALEFAVNKFAHKQSKDFKTELAGDPNFQKAIENFFNVAEKTLNYRNSTRTKSPWDGKIRAAHKETDISSDGFDAINKINDVLLTYYKKYGVDKTGRRVPPDFNYNLEEARAKQYVKPYNNPVTGEQIGWVSSDGYHKKYWQKFAKDSAIKHAKLNPDEVQEDYTGMFAAEKIPETNPYGGQKDRQHRGAISETPTDNPTGASGEGGWRKYKPKSAGITESYPANVKQYARDLAREMREEGYDWEPVDLSDTEEAIDDAREQLSMFASSNMCDFFGDYDAGEQLQLIKMFNKKFGGVKEDTAYAGGGGQGGNAGESYRKFKPKSAGTFKEDEQLDEKCWKGYKKQGTKKMFGKTYPNCVKNTNEEEQLDEKCWDSHKQVGMKKKGGKMVPNCVPKESAIMKGLKR